MIKDTWNDVILICGNHNENESIEMHLQQGPHSLFYACPEYKSIYGTNHEGRSCNNRLTLVDYEKMLNTLTDLADGTGSSSVNLTGYHWEKNGVSYKVLEHKNGKFKIKMLNKKAISK